MTPDQWIVIISLSAVYAAAAVVLFVAYFKK